MTNTPLNPDSLDETALANLIAWKSLPFGATQFVKLDANAAHKVIELLRPHLAVAQPEAQKITDAEWQAFQAIPDQGYSHRAWVDARIAERVAVAQPEVNSVEELDQLPGGSIVKSGGREFYKTSYVELPWILPYGVDRFGSSYLAKHSKVTVIHRPEVKP